MGSAPRTPTPETPCRTLYAIWGSHWPQTDGCRTPVTGATSPQLLLIVNPPLSPMLWFKFHYFTSLFHPKYIFHLKEKKSLLGPRGSHLCERKTLTPFVRRQKYMCLQRDFCSLLLKIMVWCYSMGILLPHSEHKEGMWLSWEYS